MSKNVEALAALLNQPAETVRIALEAEGGLVDRITAFRKDYTILNNADKDTLIKNAKEEGRTELLENFKPELLDKKNINRLTAWKLEQVENDLKDKYKFDGSFQGISDLVEQIVKKSGNNNADPKAEEEIAKLKKRIEEISSERDQAVTKATQEMDDFVIKTEFNRSVGSLSLDYEPDAVDKQRKLLTDSFNSTYEVRRKDGKVFVYERGKDEPLMDEKRDPLPIDTVVDRHAKEYGFKIKSPGSGGQGGSSSQKSGASAYVGMSREDFMSSLEKKGVKWSSPDGEKAYVEWRTANTQP